MMIAISFLSFYHIINANFRLLLVAECRTMATGPEPDKPCIFPFKYNGKEYFECTAEGYEDNFWCGTTYSVSDHAGWGYCSGPCKPIKGRKVLKNGNVGFRKSSAGRS